MSCALPEEILEADAALHDLFQRVAFSRYLNPVNVEEARQDFFSKLTSEEQRTFMNLLRKIALATSPHIKAQLKTDWK